MADHRGPDLGVDGVAQDGNEEEHAEKEHIESEYDDGYPVEPCSVIGQVVEEDGYDAGAHIDREPSNERHV